MSAKSGIMVRIAPDGAITQEEWAGQKPHTKTWPLAQMQRLVGGNIERVRVRYNGRVRDAYVDEEGKLKGLPLNKAATAMLVPPLQGWDVLVGPVVVWVPDPREPKGN